MTSTNNRASKTGAAPSLRDRADATKASAKRVVRKDLADQPSQESLPGGSPVDQAACGFTGHDQPRHAAAQGLDEKKDRGGAGDRRQSSGETDMGRHESFKTATPIAADLLSGTMLGRNAAAAGSGKAADGLDLGAAAGEALADVGLTSEISEEICIAIEDHRDALIAGRAETDDSDEAFDSHAAAQRTADLALRNVPCRSLADLRAKLTYLVPLMAPDMADSTHVEHLKALQAGMDRLCRERSRPAGDDAELLRLGDEMDRAHSHWRVMEWRNREPSSRLGAAIDAARARGGPSEGEYRAAWALPGIQEAHSAAEDAFSALDPICEAIWRLPARTPAGLAVKARAALVHTWANGSFEANAALGVNEDMEPKVARQLIEACCSLAGVDWRGDPIASAPRSAVGSDRDWQEWASHHPGFVPYPADKPVSLMALDSAIPLEARRLLNLAEQEFERRRQAYVGFHDPAVWPRVAASLRREMRMDALATAAAAEPIEDPSGSLSDDQYGYAFHAALNEHRLANRAFGHAVRAADSIEVQQAGGDDSDEAMAPAESARDVASERALQAWRDLFKVRPRTIHHLWLLLRHVAENYDDHSGIEDEPDVFGALVGAADGLRFASADYSAPHDLTQLSISDLERLDDVCRRQCQTLTATFDQLSNPDEPLGTILEMEATRIGVLGSTHPRLL